MKLFLPFLLFLFISSVGIGQQLALIDPVFEESVATGSLVSTQLRVKNNGDKPIRLGIRLDDPYLKGDQISSICIGTECFTKFDALEVTTLFPDEIIEDVRIRFNAGYDELTRELSLTIYDIEAPGEPLIERFTYHIKNNFPNGILFSDESLQVSKIYPNPVSSVASIDYSLASKLTPATITVHNILGDRVLELPLDASETNLKLPIEQLQNGIYFYTLQVNGKSINTKKFVVRK
ncbi:MAG: T9SS type A sorting domain-containing protein [Cyclobacteriaceae bacterium]